MSFFSSTLGLLSTAATRPTRPLSALITHSAKRSAWSLKSRSKGSVISIMTSGHHVLASPGTMHRSCHPQLPQLESIHRTIRMISSTRSAVAPANPAQRLQQLRELMKRPEYNVAAFVVPSEDAHQSEYVADCDDRRAYISGFTGSTGLVIVTQDTAALFTDGRYFLQASQQLDDSLWTLMKSGMPGVPSWQEYLVKNLPAGSRIGFDPLLFTAYDANKLEPELAKVRSQLVPITTNLIDQIWTDRPTRPAHPLLTLSTTTTGKSHLEKIQQLRQDLATFSPKDQSRNQPLAGCILSGLDEIAWLFNLRGSDVHCNPVFFASAIVTQDTVTLYLQEQAITDRVRAHLGPDVILKHYGTEYEDLARLGQALTEASKGQKAAEQKPAPKFLVSRNVNLRTVTALGRQNVVETARSPVMMTKAIKNEAELEGMRQCHLRDAVAVINYLAWLENQLERGCIVDEVDGADRLEKFRAEQKGYVGSSFDTISSTGPNGAIIHYKPTRPTAANIHPDQLYLCDSGGQYLDGTTDITRTLHFRTPTEHERRCFTRVLQGHIALDSVVFPKGTTGFQLDLLARRPLWSEGLDYRHGTGHGVGAFLNVHEGPHGCGTRPSFHEVALSPGMTLTNEPGYYEDGQFGIRIENVLVVREVKTRHEFGGHPYYGFERLTWVPIQTKMVDRGLLSEQEKVWINEYHSECREKVLPLLEKNGLGWQWLQREAVSV